jgi:ureidoglycolate lyase
MRIVAEPLTAEAFKPFGAVLEGAAAPGRTYSSDTLARAFVARAGQGVTYALGTWHHPLTVLDGPASFAVLMWRDGTTADEEFVQVAAPVTIDLPEAR